MTAKGHFGSTITHHITDVLYCFSFYLSLDYSLYCIAEVPNKSTWEYSHSMNK